MTNETFVQRDLLKNHNIDATPVEGCNGVYRSSNESDNNIFYASGYVEIDLEDTLSTEAMRQLEQFDYGTQEYDDKLNTLLDKKVVESYTKTDVVYFFQDYLYLVGVDKTDLDKGDSEILKNFEVEELERYAHHSCWALRYNGNN